MKKIHRFSWGISETAQVVVVQCGSKSTPLIAQMLREIGLMSRVIESASFAQFWRERTYTPKLVILSGGEQSVYEAGSPTLPEDVYVSMLKHATVFGICYGAQLLAKLSGGTVTTAARIESGIVRVKLAKRATPFGTYRGGKAVMNHGDEITCLPRTWRVIASTERCKHAFVGVDHVWAIQFHPEMDHTQDGAKIFREIAFRVADCTSDYAFDPEVFTRDVGEWLRWNGSAGLTVCGLSGGVDSSVAYALAKRAQSAGHLQAMFVDTGFYREGEMDEVRGWFGTDGVSYVDARVRFHEAIEAIPYDHFLSLPVAEHTYYDQVRRVIGRTFIEVFVHEVREIAGGAKFLIQGTNAADVVESETGLKAHHNVGGLPDQLGVHVIEPLAGLYKCEIRTLAKHLGLPAEIVHRQPFPGPGLAIRLWGPIHREMVPVLRCANRILEEVMRKHYPNPETRPCQYYVAFMPLPSTGLMGDRRVTGYAWGVRMVTSEQRESYATLGVFRAKQKFWDELTHRLVTETKTADGTPFVRIFYEVTGKPPSTTEPH